MMRIVYSTCSVHAIENEHVVRQALQTEEAAKAGFRLARREDVLPGWQRRGMPEEMDDPGAFRSELVKRNTEAFDSRRGIIGAVFAG